MQIAQLPGRDEPDDNGEVNFPFLFKLLNKLGYDGWVACEYVPRGERTAVFCHLPPLVCVCVCGCICICVCVVYVCVAFHKYRCHPTGRTEDGLGWATPYLKCTSSASV